MSLLKGGMVRGCGTPYDDVRSSRGRLQRERLQRHVAARDDINKSSSSSSSLGCVYFFAFASIINFSGKLKSSTGHGSVLDFNFPE